MVSRREIEHISTCRGESQKTLSSSRADQPSARLCHYCRVLQLPFQPNRSSRQTARRQPGSIAIQRVIVYAMEVMTAAHAVDAPHAQPTRDLRPGAPAPAIGAASQTQHSSPPASQESILSANTASTGYSRTLQSNGSNVSQLTDFSDLTPVLEASNNGQLVKEVYTAAEYARAHTPEDRTDGNFPPTSPMSSPSPLMTNGTKRTASGHVKNAPSLPSTPMVGMFSPRKCRTDSISSTGSRAGDLAANLKMRLGYAMTKVQNGWEHKSIGELEQMAVQPTSPHTSGGRRPSNGGFASRAAAFPMHDGHVQAHTEMPSSPPSKRRSGTYGNIASPMHQLTFSATPRLQPAADIRASHDSHSAGYAMSPPRTPVSTFAPRRPQAIRTNTQTAEAERDALQALTQLGSPHNSQFSRHRHSASQASSSQASPLRAGAMPARRVTFSDDSATESSSQDSTSNVRAQVLKAA